MGSVDVFEVGRTGGPGGDAEDTGEVHPVLESGDGEVPGQVEMIGGGILFELAHGGVFRDDKGVGPGGVGEVAHGACELGRDLGGGCLVPNKAEPVGDTAVGQAGGDAPDAGRGHKGDGIAAAGEIIFIGKGH